MNYLQVVQVFSRTPNGPALEMNQHVDLPSPVIFITEGMRRRTVIGRSVGFDDNLVCVGCTAFSCRRYESNVAPKAICEPLDLAANLALNAQANTRTSRRA